VTDLDGTISLDNGYDEVAAIVRDVVASSERLCAILDYRILQQGLPDEGMLSIHDIRPDFIGQEIVIGQPQCQRGRIRLWQPAGEAPPVRRMGAQPWDIGGFFDVSIRSLGPIDDLLARFCRNGFSAFAPVTDFNMAGLQVREALAHDGDGLCFAMAERIAPPLTGWEHVKGPASNPFNSVITVENLDSARDYFVNGLEWKALVDTALVHETGRNVMGLPLDLARSKPVKLAIVQQQGVMEGSVELIEYPCEAINFRGDEPHWRGLVSLSFPVSDLRGILDRAKSAGSKVSAVKTVYRGTFGRAQAASVLTPWAARLIFLQPD